MLLRRTADEVASARGDSDREKEGLRVLNAVILNCTLKRARHLSNTEALAQPLIDECERHGVETQLVRAVNLNVLPGMSSDEGDGDERPRIRELLGRADILVTAILGQPPLQHRSAGARTYGRDDLREGDNGLPVAYNKVAAVVVTGDEDGAHHVISEISGALIDIGYTVPGKSWTYWNKGPGPGERNKRLRRAHPPAARNGPKRPSRAMRHRARTGRLKHGSLV